MTPEAMLDALNWIELVLDYTEADLFRSRPRWLMAIPRRFVRSLRTGIQNTRKDIALLVSKAEGGAR